METRTQKILTWLSIAGGAVLLLGFIGTVVGVLISGTIDARLATTSTKLTKLEQTVALQRNDIDHLADEVEATGDTVTSFDAAFRLYLERQAAAASGL